MTVQLLSPAGSVRRHGERATVEFPGLADDDQEALPRHQPTLPKELGEGALPPYVEQEPADDGDDLGWLAKGGMLLAATSALTVGAAAAASTVEDGESDALAPPEPAVAEPAPPITGDALDKVDVTGNLVPVVPPEMLASTAAAAAPAPAAAPPAAPAAADAAAALAAQSAAAEQAAAEQAAVEQAAAEQAAAEQAAAEQAAADRAPAATPAPAGTVTQAEPRFLQVAAAAPASTSFDSGVEAQFAALTNQARAAAGAPAVVRDANLDSYARAHAARMVQAGTIYHSDISSLLGAYTTVGENVGTGPGTGDIQTALTRSPTHYANMVEPGFTSMGVGAVVDSAGMIWTVHVYGV